jgi:hypothetical protein
MYSYVFGAISMLLLGVVIILFNRFFSNSNNDLSDRREVKKANNNGKVISLNATLKNDILTAALDINFRQERLNEELLNGSYSENIENALLQLEFDRKENIRRSVDIGLISEDKAAQGINQLSS